VSSFSSFFCLEFYYAYRHSREKEKGMLKILALLSLIFILIGYSFSYALIVIPLPIKNPVINENCSKKTSFSLVSYLKARNNMGYRPLTSLDSISLPPKTGRSSGSDPVYMKGKRQVWDRRFIGLVKLLTIPTQNTQFSLVSILLRKFISGFYRQKLGLREGQEFPNFGDEPIFLCFSHQ